VGEQVAITRVQKSWGMNAVPVVLVWYTEPVAMHAAASVVALVAASVELVPVSGALASSVVLASDVLASVVLASGVLVSAAPASVVPELVPLALPAAPEVVPLAVAPLVPALAPVPLPDDVPVAAAPDPPEGLLLLLLHAAAKSPTVMPKLNLLRTFIFIPSMSKETR
jgi:hypothetical protein